MFFLIYPPGTQVIGFALNVQGICCLVQEALHLGVILFPDSSITTLRGQDIQAFHASPGIPGSQAHFFLAVLADWRNALADGAPFAPGFLILSPEPALILLRLLWMFLYNPSPIISSFLSLVS
tara:strand:- start:923 stop:1291 length:369 start_codon:yes stop_codon:yes gene_type:complete